MPDSVETFRPPNPEHFSILVQAMVAPVEVDGEESFDFVVMTPSALAEELADGDGYLFLRHRLVIHRWDADLVGRAIRDLVSRSRGTNWEEIAQKLSRFGHWEFENYRSSA